MKPGVLLNAKKQSCSVCSVKKGSLGAFSRISIQWIESIKLVTKERIQHAMNEGEYKIRTKDKTYKVDGFCKETNTVYEFLGDEWHGSPYKYAENDKCHPRTNAKAGHLFESTMRRLMEINSLGFKICWVWESDFKLGVPISGTLFIRK